MKANTAATGMMTRLTHRGTIVPAIITFQPKQHAREVNQRAQHEQHGRDFSHWFGVHIHVGMRAL